MILFHLVLSTVLYQISFFLKETTKEKNATKKKPQKTKTKNNSNKNHEVISGEITNICKMNHKFQVFCGQELSVYRQNIAKELTEWLPSELSEWNCFWSQLKVKLEFSLDVLPVFPQSKALRIFLGITCSFLLFISWL